VVYISYVGRLTFQSTAEAFLRHTRGRHAGVLALEVEDRAEIGVDGDSNIGIFAFGRTARGGGIVCRRGKVNKNQICTTVKTNLIWILCIQLSIAAFHTVLTSVHRANTSV
jgi:hypothetical protein